LSVTVKPRGSRVLIRRNDAEGITAGGIILPDGVKDKPQRGTVLALGPGRLSDAGYRIPIEHVEVGDDVLWMKYSGEAFKFSGKEEIFLVDEKEIIAVLEDPEDELDDESADPGCS
jgi:chaperonin GroES